MHDTQSRNDRPEASRRAVLLSVGTGAALLAGCSSYGDTPEQPPADRTGPAGTGDGGTGGSAGAGKALASTAEIPVGGGKVFADEKVVVTQPERGTFTAFSAVCTHQGCAIDDVSDGTINCPCHGSRFRIEDGTVTTGPAKSPLPPVSVTVAGDTITLA